MKRLRTVNWSALSPPARIDALLRPAMTGNPGLDDRVRAIMAEVRRDGDAALLRFAKDLDKVELSSLRVSEEEAAAAEAALPADARAAITAAIANVRRFHEAQLPPPLLVETAPGVIC